MHACPDENAILAFVDGRLPAEAVTYLESHVTRCQACDELLSVAVASLRGGAGSDGASRAVRIGRFTLIEPVGHGGSSVVYRARDALTGEEVALKTVRTDSPGLHACFRREIHVLSRLRHPSIVRVLDHGAENGRPWYAMELLDGETLSDRNARLFGAAPSGDSRPAAAGALRETLTLIARLCEPLAFLHGEGIVHRDLKPQNILVRRDGRPVLLDFGMVVRVAGASGRETSELPQLEGTPAYMAPEQIAGDLVDARSDLYALGCVLYELLTGRPPFVGNNSEVLHQHLHAAPAPPSRLVDGLPAELDELTLGLLRKRPRERVGHAADVRAALSSFEILDESRPFAPRPRAYVYRPGLVGREDVLDELAAVGRAACAGHGRCVLLGGESGVGKTYAALEAARRARADMFVVNGSCLPPDALPVAFGGAPLHPLRTLLNALADECLGRGEEAVQRVFGARGKVLAPLEPRIGALPGQESWPEPPELNGAAARYRLIRCLAESVAEFARERPLLVFLDDLQWADELTIEFLKELCGEWLEGKRLLLLGTYRLEETPSALEELLRQREVRGLEIGRLGPSVLRVLVADMLAIEDPPDAFVQWLAQQSEGNPFFIEEYIRTAVAEGLIRRVSSRLLEFTREWTSDGRLALPGSIRELITRRLHGLDDVTQRALDQAAVFGREFDGELVQLAAGLGEEELLEAVTELLAKQVAEQPRPGRYRFMHDKLREIAYGDIAPDRRTRLHAAAASALERRYRGAADFKLFYSVIAHHHEIAGNEEQALEYLDLAAHHSLTIGAFEDAATLFGRALEHAAGRDDVEAARRGRWSYGLARADFARGDLPSFERNGFHALRLFGHPLPETRSGWLGLLGRQLATQLLHLAGVGFRVDAGARDALFGAASVAGQLSHRYFYADDALRMISTALLSVNLVERIALDAPVPHAYALMGSLAGLLRRHQLARSYFARAEGSAARPRDPSYHALALAIESVYHGSFGRWDEAEPPARRAEELALQAHDPAMHEIVLAAIGHVEYFTGRFETARLRYVAVLESALARANQQHMTWAQFSIARSLNRLGQFDEALQMLQQARASLDRSPEKQSEIICDGLLAVVSLRLGRAREAEQFADRTLAAIEQTSPTGYPSLEGYGAISDVYIELLEREPKRAAELRRKARRVTRALLGFAAVFPVARPALLLHLGGLQRIDGRSWAAGLLFRRCLQQAEDFNMPREAAAAQLALARIAPSDERARYLESAEARFRALGCVHELRRIAAS
jgi:tetratricopeptide (TPR) repeat protein